MLGLMGRPVDTPASRPTSPLSDHHPALSLVVADVTSSRRDTSGALRSESGPNGTALLAGHEAVLGVLLWGCDMASQCQNLIPRLARTSSRSMKSGEASPRS
jgi:hypothetical protein